MASSSREDPTATVSGRGGGEGGGDGSDRRYPHTLQGLLTFSTEHTPSQGSSTNTAAVLDPERRPPTANDNDKGNDPELARTNQDKALQVLGLHRYRIAGDGNCLFRAVSKQLKLDQEKFHPMLRRAAVKWMRENKHELLEWGLLDGEKEIIETEQQGVWPGQAAIVALANILGINVAVIQGGDKGDIDIQHICPFETPIDKEQGSIILAYLYNGHYDAVVEEANVANPEFDKWMKQRNKEYEADEALARKLAAEEGDVHVRGSIVEAKDQELALRLAESASEDLARRLADEDYNAAFGTTAIPTTTTSSYPGSTVVSTVENKLEEPGFRHVSHIRVNYTQPSEKEHEATHGLVRSPHNDVHPLSGVSSIGRSKPLRIPPTSDRFTEAEFSPRFKPAINVHRGSHSPRSGPIRSYSEDDAPTLKLTLYPKKPLNDTNKVPYKSAGNSQDLIVTRQTPTNNALRERQYYDNNALFVSGTLQQPASSKSNNALFVSGTLQQPASSKSTVRVIPIDYSGMNNEGVDRRAAVKRREYAQHGPSSSWSHSPPEFSRSEPQRDAFRRSPTGYSSPTSYPSPADTTTRHRPHNVPHTRVYTLSDEPVGYSEDNTYDMYDTVRSYRSEPRPRPPVKTCDVPVVVLRPSLMPHPSHARATPAPVTINLDKNFQRPPQLQLIKPNIGEALLERSLRRKDFWL